MTKKLLKEPNIHVCHVHFAEGDFGRNLEVIILQTSTERYIVKVKGKFTFPNLVLNFVAETLKISIVKNRFSLSEFPKKLIVP